MCHYPALCKRPCNFSVTLTCHSTHKDALISITHGNPFSHRTGFGAKGGAVFSLESGRWRQKSLVSLSGEGEEFRALAQGARIESQTGSGATGPVAATDSLAYSPPLPDLRARI